MSHNPFLTARPDRYAENPTEHRETVKVSACDDWILHEYAETGSTNFLAADLPAWHAVRADTQTAGRGRFQRTWVSDAGGLWLSAVVPTGPDSPAGRALPLVVGLAVSDALGELGVADLRMRWPNDLLVADRKLAGLLIDQFKPGLAVAGIGVNVHNQPEARDGNLKDQTARLADLIPASPQIQQVTSLILRHLRRNIEAMHAGKFQSLLPRVNALWGGPRKVELDLDGDLHTGRFGGVQEDGRLILLDKSGFPFAYAPWQVRHLKEMD